MPRTATTVAFDALQVVGGLLPSALLEQVAEGRASEQADADYGLERGERLRDQIDAAWVRLKELWAEYVDFKERAGQSAAGLHLGLRLLREVFGWSDLQPVSGYRQGEWLYPITHRAFGGAVPLIVKGIPATELDQGMTAFGQEHRKRSPHGCLQECLNADDQAVWGLICCGDGLRLLHDNPSLVKPAHLSVDLELLVEGEKFDEFAVLWLTLHASRFQHPGDGHCVLDRWKQEAEQTGERVLGQLRAGVENALVALGNGFLVHPANHSLRQALQEGTLSTQAFHEQLLQLVYRFLFLLTAEDRDLLFPLAIERQDPRRQIYRQGYSVGRLRKLALQRSAYEGQYGDLWEVQRLVFSQLSREGSPLGLPGLGGLFDPRHCRHLQECELQNRFLLRAIRQIGWFRSSETGSLTRVNYRDLNTEELGSVYEGLLELHPQVKPVGTALELSYGAAAGSDRKMSGSYYTPDALVQELIKSALVPVIQDRLAKAAPGQEAAALLEIKVIDPACGSGHFLLAAARRLAVELAQVRAGNDQPSELDRQRALREVVSHCIYAVDKNPMAVELCKVALWIEAIEPGKPLGFLDAHIQCGDSLVGVFDPKVLEEGIPDGAYKPLTGDNKTVCTSLKKENATYRKTASKGGGLQGSLDLGGTGRQQSSQKGMEAIEAMPEDSLAEIAAKAAAYARWQQEAGVSRDRLAADLYCAAFFLPITSEGRPVVPTTEHLLKVRLGQPIPEPMEAAIQEAAKTFRFFHWHLGFGEVMERGGFDCVLANPPWERIKLQEKEFFASRSEAIATAPNKAARERLIQALRDPEALSADEALVREFVVAKREAEGSGEFIRGSGRFALTAVGDLNTYALFAELFLNLIGPSGRAGLIVPTGIATDNSTKAYFDAISSGRRLVSLYDFRTGPGLFSEIGHQRFKFSLITLGEAKQTDFVFFALQVHELSDARRHFTLDSNDFALLNPNTRTCPVFRSQMDAELTKKIYSRVPVLIDEALGEQGNPWGIKFMTMFHMSNDSHLFFDEPAPDRLPLYEAKLIHHYDHRWATYDADGSSRDVTLAEKQDPGFQVSPRYWVERAEVQARLKAQSWKRQWLMGWRDITNATNERTVIASVTPIVGAGNKLPQMFIPTLESKTISLAAILLANLSSLTYDFCSRQKIGGTTLNFFIYKQLPVLPPRAYNQTAIDFIKPRVLELTYTSHELKSWAEDLGFAAGPPFTFEPERRALLRAELDAYYAHLYGLNRDELRYILDPADVMGPDYPSETFRVLKTNEIKEFGEYRTQRLVLEAWDRLFEI